MNVFLDVGAHCGQSLAAALAHGFGRIVCFEPVPSLWERLERIEDSRVSVERFGLLHENREALVYDPGTKGGSLYRRERERKNPPEAPVACEFKRASEWFRENVDPTDTVWLKLNCEGAECDILDDLLDSGEWAKVTHALVSFHGRKIEALREREAETRERLKPYPNVTLWENIEPGASHEERITNWLSVTA